MVWFTLALVSLSPKPFLATEYIKAAVVTGGFRYLRLLRTPSLPVATQCLQVSMRGTPFINRAPLCMTFGTAGVLAWLQMRNAKNSKKEICSPSLSTQEQTALIVARVHCGEYACIYIDVSALGSSIQSWLTRRMDMPLHVLRCAEKTTIYGRPFFLSPPFFTDKLTIPVPSPALPNFHAQPVHSFCSLE